MKLLPAWKLPIHMTAEGSLLGTESAAVLHTVRVIRLSVYGPACLPDLAEGVSSSRRPAIIYTLTSFNRCIAQNT